MPNPNSIISDAHEEIQVHTSQQMHHFLQHYQGAAKDKATVMAILALGAPDTLVAMRMAQRAEEFMQPHLPQTRYQMDMHGRHTLRIQALTPQKNLCADELVLNVDLINP